jgi:hypothetical protein
MILVVRLGQLTDSIHSDQVFKWLSYLGLKTAVKIHLAHWLFYSDICHQYSPSQVLQ